MEILIFISIVIIIFISIVILNIVNKLKAGKKAYFDYLKTDSELSDLKKIFDSKKQEYKKKSDKFKSKISDLKKELSQNQIQYEEVVKAKDQLFEKIKEKSSKSLEDISSLIADHLTLQYDISADYLKTKKHPAFEEAKRIKELKVQTKEILQRNKILQYKYEYLFSLFPDLEIYADDIESINELNNLNDLGELKDIVDKTRYYLSKEEYNQLSENERNQLALDRYIKSQKSKWQIGRDYELFIGYEYSKNGWDIDYFGIDKQLEDMGRDLIATKDNQTHIIQCKYWSQKKLIHEKHIAQLYGTTVQFILSSLKKHNTFPVFVTNISLSETAKLFADYLDVKVIENKDMTEFPRIKCNINKDDQGNPTKIYHLPMDQQYDRTKICNPGEFFAFTVKEAVSAGFRRAWRWHGDS